MLHRDAAPTKKNATFAAAAYLKLSRLPASGSGANLVENHSKITIASQPDDSFILISRNLQNLRDARFPVSSISPAGTPLQGAPLAFSKIFKHDLYRASAGINSSGDNKFVQETPSEKKN
jgi:hypothetical protein